MRVEAKVLAVLWVVVDGAHEGAVVAVYARIECGDEEAEVELRALLDSRLECDAGRVVTDLEHSFRPW